MKPQMTLEKFDKIIIGMLKKRGYDTKIIKTPGRFGIEHRLVKKGARKNTTMAAVRMTEAYNEYFDELNSSDTNTANTACEEIADSIYRVGGDEFIAIVKEITETDLKRICDEIKKVFELKNCSISIGTALYPGDGKKRTGQDPDLGKSDDCCDFNCRRSAGRNFILQTCRTGCSQDRGKPSRL